MSIGAIALAKTPAGSFDKPNFQLAFDSGIGSG
jgi:hypothetical protein